MIARLTSLYLAIFAVVMAILSGAAYRFMAEQYRALLLPALGTPEADRGYAIAMQHVTLTIALFDIPIFVAVGLASYVLARSSLVPFFDARKREARFVAEAAHELRSPLASISTIAQAAAHRSAAEMPSAFEQIARTALDTSELVSELLTLVREPSPALLQRAPVDLALVASAVLREFEARASGAGLHFDRDLKSAIVDGDERRLREMLRNLIDNALRYAKTTVTIRAGLQGRLAVVAVEDDGAGVLRADSERIFERFERGSTEGPGTGLGLSIARWVAQAHDGTLVLDRHRVVGATFIARIPLLRIG